MKKFIAIAGNIGVGKSTLVEKLCAKLKWEPFFEGVVDNPYLADFYQDMRAWSFHSQIFFLARRLHDLRQLRDFPRTVVQDRSVYEDAEIFAKNLYKQGHISARLVNLPRTLSSLDGAFAAARSRGVPECLGADIAATHRPARARV